ncbi:MAG: hypothetical protein AAFO91_19425, partial [Bacteroidota bacterium]
ETITGNWEVQDDVDFTFGSDADWNIQYDEVIDNQLLFVTTNVGTAATTDPMFEILVPASPTANQQLFGIAKGSQSSNSPVFSVDEDGDVDIQGSITSADWAGGVIGAAYIADDISIGALGSVDDGALSVNVSLLGSSVEENELNITGSPTNGYVLQASSTSAGGFVWTATSTLGITDTNTQLDENTVESYVFDSDVETITGNWVNTTHPWADNEVVDALTISSSGSVDDGALSANVSLLGSAIDISSETNLAAGNGITLTGDTLTVTAAGGLSQATGGLTTTGVLEDLNTLGAAASDGEFIVATGAGTFAYESGATARVSLGVDAAGTDNSTNVTLTGTPD